MSFKKIKVCLFLFVIIIFSQCNNRGLKTIEKEFSNKQLKIKKDTLIIGIDSTLLSEYSKYSVVKDKDVYFYGYNKFKNSIDVFNFTTAEYEKSLLLEKEGPNGVESISAINVINKDSICITSPNKFYIVNSDSNIIFKKAFNSGSEEPFFKTQYLYPMNMNPSYSTYDQNTGEIYYHLVEMVRSKRRNKGDYFNQNIMGTYHVLKNKLNTLPIKYPIEYQENYYGYNDLKSYAFTKEKIYYTLSALPYIYEYDKKIKTSKKFQVKESDLKYFKTNHLAWDDIDNNDKKMKHYITNSKFGPIHATQDHILRFYRSGVPDGVLDIKNPIYSNNYLSVYNSELELIKDMELSKGLGFKLAFTFENELYIPIVADKEDNENSLKFLKMNFND